MKWSFEVWRSCFKGNAEMLGGPGFCVQILKAPLMFRLVCPHTCVHTYAMLSTLRLVRVELVLCLSMVLVCRSLGT